MAKRGASLAEQITHLRSRLTLPEIQRAEELSKSSPTVVALAFKLSRPYRTGSRLTKTEQRIVDELKAVSPQKATEREAQMLAAKQAKVAGKPKKQAKTAKV